MEQEKCLASALNHQFILKWNELEFSYLISEHSLKKTVTSVFFIIDASIISIITKINNDFLIIKTVKVWNILYFENSVDLIYTYLD